MGCAFCDNGYCRHHYTNLEHKVKGRTLNSGINYSKTYKILDLTDMTTKEIVMRSSKQRMANTFIEVYTASATCRKCRKFTECDVYSVKTRSNSRNFALCDFCKEVQFANTDELRDFVTNALNINAREYMLDDN